MIHFLITVFSALVLGIQVVKEKAEPVVLKGTRFDWDMYWADVDNGIPTMEQVRKRQCGGYVTTRPLPEPKKAIPKVVDMKRYQHDKELYDKAIAEAWRKMDHTCIFEIHKMKPCIENQSKGWFSMHFVQYDHMKIWIDFQNVAGIHNLKSRLF